MPRNAGGDYSLSPGNPVVSGTIIQSSWANPTMDDLAEALTDSLSRTGQGNMLVPFRVPDGSAVSPSFSFLNNVLSGLYLFAANDVRMSVNGVDLARFENGKIQQWDATGMQWIDILGTIDAHIANDTGAHAASAISVVPFDDIVAIEVQAALEEVRATTSSEVPVLYQGNTTNPLVDLKLKNTIDFQGVGAPTFTRASSATYVDRYGVVQSATTDEIRFEAEGALLEGASTNIFNRSAEFDNGDWVQQGTVTVTPNTTTAPDGSLTADTINVVFSDSLGQTQSANDTGTYAFSCFIKKSVATTFHLRALFLNGSTLISDNTYNFDTGEITGNAVAKKLSNGWVRFSTVLTNNGSGNTQVNMRLSTVDAGDTFVWGAQVEELTFSSSYIPTVASTVARAADILSVSQLNNLPATLEEFSAVADFSIIGDVGSAQNQFVYQIPSVANNGLLRVSDLDVISVYGTTIQILGSTTPSTAVRAVTTYNTSNVITTFKDGVQSTQGDAGTAFEPDTSDVIYIGIHPNFINSIWGHISRLQIFDRDLSSFEASIV